MEKVGVGWMVVSDWLAYIGSMPYIKVGELATTEFWVTALSHANWLPSVDESVASPACD